MTLSLYGKKAIVTGASSGIGRATAKMMVDEGAEVALVARSAKRLEKVREEIGKEKSFVIPTDLTNTSEIVKMVRTAKKQLGRIDIIHANAGVYVAGEFETCSHESLETILSTNINSVMHSIREVLPIMIAQGIGDIVVTSSISGHQAIHWEPIYSASKHAIQSFVHGLRIQLGKKNIRVGEVAPGIVLNELWGISDPEEIKRRSKLGEGLKSSDVAEAVIFILSRPRNVGVRDIVLLPRVQEI